jgi:hypothetical protein
MLFYNHEFRETLKFGVEIVMKVSTYLLTYLLTYSLEQSPS